MKKVQINQAKTEIDWSKPMWVQHKEEPTTIVLTSGNYTGNRFEGACLPCKEYPKGEIAADWAKVQFRPLVGEIQFTISNED
jgi:hypothetical protein